MLEDRAYGFVWNQLAVERTTIIRDNLILTLKTKRETVQIRVTPSGLIKVNARWRNKKGCSESNQGQFQRA